MVVNNSSTLNQREAPQQPYLAQFFNNLCRTQLASWHSFPFPLGYIRKHKFLRRGRHSAAAMSRSRAEGDPSPPAPLLPAPNVPLGNNIFLIEPVEDHPSTILNSSDGGSGPSLIILCTWLGGATMRRIVKYVEGYRATFPGATLILIRTVLADITTRSFAAVRSRLQPARDAIIQALQSTSTTTTSPDALLHIFSHGGCNTAIQLAQSLSDTDTDTGALFRDRLRLIIFDCCPGDASFNKAFHAAVVSLPPTLSSPAAPLLPLRALGVAAVFALVATVTALQRAGLMASVDDMRRALNDPALFGSAARRLYLFSHADSMVDPESVRSHAQLAHEEVGCEVGLVAFREAAHCALLAEDAGRYWRAVGDCWAGRAMPRLSERSDGAKL